MNETTPNLELIATKYEEADLIQELGDDYVRYRTEVPAFLPGTKG